MLDVLWNPLIGKYHSSGPQRPERLNFPGKELVGVKIDAENRREFGRRLTSGPWIE